MEAFLGVTVCLGEALGPFPPGFVGGTFLLGPEQSGVALCMFVATDVVWCDSFSAC
jgi:hypothetical protein